MIFNALLIGAAFVVLPSQSDATVIREQEAPNSAPSPVPIDPATWITSGDYPEASLRAGESGTVAFEVDVDEAGGVAGCRIVRGTGFGALDQAVCPLMVKRGRFHPARDSGGQPVRSTFSSKVTWDTPGRGGLQPLQSWRSVVTLGLSAEGKVTACKETHHVAGSPEPIGSDAACDHYRRETFENLVAGQAGELVFLSETSVQGSAIAEPSPTFQHYERLYHETARFDVDASGRATNCRTEMDVGGEPRLKPCVGDQAKWNRPATGPVAVRMTIAWYVRRADGH